ncbi:MAG: hypothetical protein NTY99_01865 [DPANN group archaeon]|nr:hypothetical protein [DPANN group archaeon]
MQFQNLPDTVFSNTPFNVVVLVTNAGESNLLANDVKFVFDNAANFNVTMITQSNSEALASSKKIGSTEVPGGQQLITWPDAAFTGTVLTTQQKVTMAVEACYPYKSLGAASVCIARTSKICNPAGDKPIQSSGAPVQFTSFNQVAQSANATTVSVQITAGIENKGVGTVYSSSAQCPLPSVDDLDSVRVTGIKLGDKALPLNCDENPVTLDQGKGDIRCSFDVSTTADIQDQLSIELAYKYKNKISSEIAVIPRSGIQKLASA